MEESSQDPTHHRCTRSTFCGLLMVPARTRQAIEKERELTRARKFFFLSSKIIVINVNIDKLLSGDFGARIRHVNGQHYISSHIFDSNVFPNSFVLLTYIQHSLLQAWHTLELTLLNNNCKSEGCAVNNCCD